MTAIATGLKVTAHYSYCPMGSISIQETFLTGEITKVNAKSFRVSFTESVRTGTGMEPSRSAIKTIGTFRFWKEASNGRQLYRGDVNGSRFVIKL